MRAAEHPLRRVLIANRGEIAVRVARTCRVLGVGTVAVHSVHDVGAPHVVACDRAVPVGSYLDGSALIDAALATGCDAVHPGYGFLSENADFAAAVAEAGLVFVGPPAAAMEVMGSKTAARRAMVAAGVPVVPGSAAGGPAVLERAAEAIGYPVLVKASGGGGGKGMTIVREAGDFTRAVLRAAAEARRSFGDATVYLEKLIERPRHVEIQVFADDHGHCVSLGERECSIQRRHQKIVEEAPSPVVDAALRERLGRAAVRAAEAVGYRGAGTVELLLSQEGEFWFLEMNTRLQVEHPVTECVTGLDLVRLQLDVAAGSPLPAAALEPTLRGWAIEARVYAEDPAAGHLPQAGPLLAVREPQGPGVRVDSGVAEGGEVSVHYDPLLAKVIGWGADRDEAIDRLRDALARHVILGVRTNLEHLQAILGHPAFREGRLSTAFLDEHLSGWPGAQEVPDAALAATVLPVGRAAAGRGSQRGAQHGASDPWATLTGFRVGPREEP